MGAPSGEWRVVQFPGYPDQLLWAPCEQPPSPDGTAGRWHVVPGGPGEPSSWAWVPHPAPAPLPTAAPAAMAPGVAAGAVEIRAESSEPPRQPGRLRRPTAMVVAAALTVGVAVAGLRISSFLSGGGTQPDDVLRAGAMGFVRIDLDPSASQKLAAWRLSQKFPDAFVDKGKDQVLKNTVVAAWLEGGPLSYDSDVAPWLGNRAGVAIYPPKVPGAAPVVAFAIEYTDETAMGAAMDKLNASEPTSWVTRDSYVVVAQDTSEAAGLVAESGSDSLAQQSTFHDDIASLGGNELAVGWMDFGQLVKEFTGAAQADGAPDLLSMFPEGLPTGRLVMGLHADASYLELQGRTIGATAPPTPAAAGTNLAGAFPADSVAAASFTGAAGGAPAAGGPGGPADWKELGKALGVKLPADPFAAFGQESAIALGKIAGRSVPQLTVRTHGGDRKAADQLVKALREGGIKTVTRALGADLVVGTTAAQVTDVVDGGPTLAETDAFKRAVPDAAGAATVIFVNVERLIAEGIFGELTADDRQSLARIEAIGFSAAATPEGDFRLRFTVR